MPLQQNQRRAVNALFPIANLFPQPSQATYDKRAAALAAQQQQQQQQQMQNNSYGFQGGSFNALPSGDFWKGAPGGLLNINKFQPGQEGYLNSLLQQLQGGTQNLNLPGQPTVASQLNFAPQAEQAQRQFNQVTVPGLAERFAAMGSGDKGSSAFTNSLGAAGADLQSQLAALGSQYGLQQGGLHLQEQGLQGTNLFNLLQQYLQPRQDNLYVPSQSSGAATLARGAVQAGAQALPYLAML